MKTLALAAAATLVGCSAPPPAAEPVAPSVPSVSAGAPDDPPSARVNAVSPPSGKATYARVRIVFSNPTKKPCKVPGYKLVWGDKSKAITLQDLTLPPGETRDRWIRIDPDEADVATLTMEVLKVEGRFDCGG